MPLLLDVEVPFLLVVEVTLLLDVEVPLLLDVEVATEDKVGHASGLPGLPEMRQWD